MVLSNSSQWACDIERPERIARIEVLLRQSGGVSMVRLVEDLNERRSVISEDLEAMRDEMGIPVQWNPDTGAFFLGEENRETTRDESIPKVTDLSLLFQALELEQRIYVITSTAAGDEEQIYGLPKDLKTSLGGCSFVMLTEPGVLRQIDLESVRKVKEAFGSRK